MPEKAQSYPYMNIAKHYKIDYALILDAAEVYRRDGSTTTHQLIKMAWRQAANISKWQAAAVLNDIYYYVRQFRAIQNKTLPLNWDTLELGYPDVN
mgnify:CR=1 FL=1